MGSYLLAGLGQGASQGLESLAALQQAAWERKRREEQDRLAAQYRQEDVAFRGSEAERAAKEFAQEQARLRDTATAATEQQGVEAYLRNLNQGGVSVTGDPRQFYRRMAAPQTGISARPFQGGDTGTSAALQAIGAAEQERTRQRQGFPSAIGAAGTIARKTQAKTPVAGYEAFVAPQEFNPDTGQAAYYNMLSRQGNLDARNVASLNDAYKNVVSMLNSGPQARLISDMFTSQAERARLEPIIKQRAASLFISQIRNMGLINPVFKQLPVEDPAWVEQQVAAIMGELEARQAAVDPAAVNLNRPVNPLANPADVAQPEAPSNLARDADLLRKIKSGRRP